MKAFTTVAPTVALLVLLAPTAEAKSPPVKEVVGKVQSLYNTTKDLKGKFKQVYTDTLYNRVRTHHGYLYVKKPGKMRWNYSSPERKSFISDGKMLWVYEPRDKQAFKNPLNTDTLSTGLTFLLGSGKLQDEFNVSYATEKKDLVGGPDHFVLKLTPKKPTAQYEYLVLAVRKSDFVVEESMIVGKHARNHFVFTTLKFDTGLQDWRFRFKPPKDVRVVDGSKMRR
ncbi:MAG: outer membrane lipoprotein chaperone LolA [Deltaproteobacteria bacterium]|nr:outer membrane lipoprotein chaperone LolA [Deltaproteobacteria bacterium]